jgi:hypothetical protein
MIDLSMTDHRMIDHSMIGVHTKRKITMDKEETTTMMNKNNLIEIPKETTNLETVLVLPKIAPRFLY